MWKLALLLSVLVGVALPARAWELAAVPGPAAGEGFATRRCWIRVPEAWRGRRLILTIGATAGADETWFNGARVAAHGSLPPFHDPPAGRARLPAVIPEDLVRPGAWNLIALRMFSRGGPAGITGGPVQLSAGDEALDLSGLWEFRSGDDPAWAQPGPEPDVAGEVFLRRASDQAPGRAGLTPVDKAARRRALEEVARRFESSPDVQEQTEDKGPPLDPAAALAAFRVADGLAIETVLAEPQVRQPLFLTFDARGRLWVVEHNQHPDPAGLELVAWDEQQRKVFDRVPPPPPHRGEAQQRFFGRDRVVIHEDTDGDGRFDRRQVFLDGGNLVTSVAPAGDGVWVLNPPYLLFYPDADGDDVPDGDPVVHLSGFGLEDARALASSLKFGPDGWLYGATGGAATARVRTERAPERAPVAFLGQAVWRYHPGRHVFEIFAEGGRNALGVDFDDEGNLFSGASDGLQAAPFVQGGYYRKDFGRHGPYTNPHALACLGGQPNAGEQARLAPPWLVYGGGVLPGRAGQLFGVDSQAGRVIALGRERHGSTFRAYEADRLVATPDRWFHPVQLEAGPDGAVYLADRHDARISRKGPRDTSTRERGRVYRLKAAGSAPKQPENLRALPTDELLDRLSSPNRWQRWSALRVLVERRDPAALPELRKRLDHAALHPALEALWALHQLEARDAAATLKALQHPAPPVRAWAVRLAGDRRATTPPRALDTMRLMAQSDPSPAVFSQLAATAQRLRPEQGWPLLTALTLRRDFDDDPQIPAQIWWAWEAQLSRRPEDAVAVLQTPGLWERRLFREAVAGRLGRRLAAERSPAAFKVLGDCLRTAPTRGAREQFLEGMAEGFEGVAADAAPPAEFLQAFDAALATVDPSLALVHAGLRLRVPAAVGTARRTVRDPAARDQDRAALLTALAEAGESPEPDWLLEVVTGRGQPEAVRMAAARVLAGGLGEFELRGLWPRLPGWPEAVRETFLLALAGRLAGAQAIMTALEAGTLPRELVPASVVQALRSCSDAGVAAAVERVWGRPRPPEA